ncbi:MAG: sensor histidine kinase [Candidatus Omnitrophota bacterium]
MGITKFLSGWVFTSGGEDHPKTFKEELRRQCNAILIPVALLAIISWPIFIPLDIDMFPDIPSIVYLRWGLTGVGCLSLVLYLFVPFFKKHGNVMMHFILYYLGIATAIILGLVSGHASYMGGFAIVVVVSSLIPMTRIHALFHLLVTLVAFKLAAVLLHVNYQGPLEAYGLLNFLLCIGIAIMAIYVFDNLRENSYRKSRLLKNANEDLLKANELKNNLVKMAAHNLKDPLQVIIGYTEILQTRLSADKFAAERLRIIYRSTDRMIKLIGGFLEITSIENGKLPMNKSIFNLEKVIEASINAHEAYCTKKNQKIRRTLEENCMIYGDMTLIRQVANHLIDNAIKFSPPGKSIWVTVEKHEEWIEFKVKDEGPGLTPEESERVFEKFSKLSPKPTGGEISTGLGLAIAKDLVELHGGSIWVTSEPGNGSIFSVQLQACEKTDDGGDDRKPF